MFFTGVGEIPDRTGTCGPCTQLAYFIRKDVIDIHYHPKAIKCICRPPKATPSKTRSKAANRKGMSTKATSSQATSAKSTGAQGSSSQASSPKIPHTKCKCVCPECCQNSVGICKYQSQAKKSNTNFHTKATNETKSCWYYYFLKSNPYNGGRSDGEKILSRFQKQVFDDVDLPKYYNEKLNRYEIPLTIFREPMRALV